MLRCGPKFPNAMGKVEILSSDRAKVFGDPTIRGITSSDITKIELAVEAFKQPA